MVVVGLKSSTGWTQVLYGTQIMPDTPDCRLKGLIFSGLVLLDFLGSALRTMILLVDQGGRFLGPFLLAVSAGTCGLIERPVPPM